MLADRKPTPRGRAWSLPGCSRARPCSTCGTSAASGWANAFYAAAAQAGSKSWKAFLFGAIDAGNGITVDKTPASLWPMGISAPHFGVNSWGLLVPQALEGVAAVGVLFASAALVRPGSGWHRRRRSRDHPGRRGDVPVQQPRRAPGAAADRSRAYALTPRPLERGADAVAHRVPGGGLLGFAFLAKSLQAFLVVPGFALVYLYAVAPVVAGAPLHGTSQLTAATPLAVSGGWYLAMVAGLWPASSRARSSADRPATRRGDSRSAPTASTASAPRRLGRRPGPRDLLLGRCRHHAPVQRADGRRGIRGCCRRRCSHCSAGSRCATDAPSAPIRARRTALLVWGSWLVVDGCGVQLHDRHRAHLLHGRAGAGDRGGARDRRDASCGSAGWDGSAGSSPRPAWR